MKKSDQKELIERVTDYTIRLSNSASNNRREAIQRLIEAAQELGFADGQAHVASALEDILKGEE